MSTLTWQPASELRKPIERSRSSQNCSRFDRAKIWNGHVSIYGAGLYGNSMGGAQSLNKSLCDLIVIDRPAAAGSCLGYHQLNSDRASTRRSGGALPCSRPGDGWPTTCVIAPSAG